MSSVTRSLFVVDSSSSTAVRLACLVLVGSLAGCSTIEGWFSTDKVDYKTAARQNGNLDVPPDLTQLAKDNRAQVQGGTVTASAMAAQQQQGNAAAASGTSPRPAAAGMAGSRTVALSTVGDATIERSGTTRWVHSTLTPEQVWPQVISFWKERGFEIASEQADIGVMETEWTEDRSKLPQDIIRKTLGRLIDGLYSSGEKDMYRIRVERDDKGGTDIFISHHGKQEVYNSSQRDSTIWQDRPSDPLLEGEMLSRLMLKLGGRAADANADVIAAAAAASAARSGDDVTGPPIVIPSSTLPTDTRARPLSEVPNSIVVNEGFERAWRRVGQSLDRHGFTIEDRDRTLGMFFLRYADPAQAGKDEPNFFQRLFSGDKGPEPIRYRVLVKADGDHSVVSILDNKGQQQTSDIAKGILNLLMDDLR